MEQVTKDQIIFLMREMGILNKDWHFDMYAQGMIDYKIDISRNQYVILTIDSDDFFDQVEKGKDLIKKSNIISLVFAIHNRKDYTKMRVLQYVADLSFEALDYDFCLN